jgi:threonine synthase
LSFVTHLESALDGTRLSADWLQTLHRDRPLWVRYDLDGVRRAVRPDAFRERPPTLWRYRELLPMNDEQAIVTLGEGVTPLLPAPRLGAMLGLEDLWIKDESQLPTGSFKSRGMAVAVTMAARFGIRRVAVPTAGNAGGALAAYGARAGLEVFVFMPADTPAALQHECVQYGANVFTVDGLITDCARIVRQGCEPAGWFDMATLKEPYRVEGKKTMGLELAEQLGWVLPDVIIYPTGGGTGLIGMWKAFDELRRLGWLVEFKLPRMIAVQSDGCAPIVRGFEQGKVHAAAWDDARTTAWGLRVPAAIGDFMILQAIRESGGTALAVPEQDIAAAAGQAAAAEGIDMSPEGGACVLAARLLRERGAVQPGQRVVIFNTGSARKYQDGPAPDLPMLRPDEPVDYAALVSRPSGSSIA